MRKEMIREELKTLFNDYDRTLKEIAESYESIYAKEVCEKGTKDRLIETIRGLIEEGEE